MKYFLFGHRLKIWLASVLVLSLLTTACGADPGSTTGPQPQTTISASVSPGNSPQAIANSSPAASSPSAQSNPGVQTIRIYTSLPLTGNARNVSQSLINAMQLALSDATNGTSMVGNFKIDFVPLDHASPSTGLYDVEREAANARKVANDPDAMLYLGPINTATAQASIPILNTAGIAMISPGTTYPGLTKSVAGITKADEPAKYYPTGTRNFFRLLPTDELQGRADASFTDAKLELQKVYLVEDGTDYGVGLAKSYEQAASEYNLKLVGRASLPNISTEYSQVVNKIRDAQPEVIFYGGSSQPAARLIKAVRAAGLSARFLGGGGIQDDIFLKEAGTAGVGIYSSISGTDSAGLSDKGAAFLNAYRANYGDTLQSITIYGYDAMSAAVAAIKGAGKKDREAILKAVASLKKFVGASGTWSFDPNGDTNLTVFCFYISKDQKWAFESVADTTTNLNRPSSPVAPPADAAPVGLITPTRPPTPPALAGSITPPIPTPSPPPASAPIGQRLDAASQLPPAFVLYKLGGLPVTVYVPPVATSAEPVQVLLSLHGMFNNGGNFGPHLLPFAQKHGMILVVPTFNYNVNFKSPEIIANEDLDLTAQMNQMLKQLAQTTRLTFKDKVLLFGFSRGAQLAHHYAMLYPSRTLGATVLSAGAYTLPLSERDNKALLFPFGVSNLSKYTKHSFDRATFAQIPFDVQVGALDNDPAQVSRAWDNYSGNNRVARGESFYRALGEAGVKAQFTVVPNTSHEVNKAQVEAAERFLQTIAGS